MQVYIIEYYHQGKYHDIKCFEDEAFATKVRDKFNSEQDCGCCKAFLVVRKVLHDNKES